MRLTRIKLAGFKSFVDPTSIHFPSNLTGIVGPNGCGKSNIIDAVRWVLGEISATHLRGDSMADVIFNGSSARKPVGTRLDRAGVRQQRSARSAASTPVTPRVSLQTRGIARRRRRYYLHQRRALSAHATSRHSSSAPALGAAQLRDHRAGHDLAARSKPSRRSCARSSRRRPGISKYKERRRETENRMAHTRENLERLNDLREEVEKQIRHLQRQAASRGASRC